MIRNDDRKEPPGAGSLLRRVWQIHIDRVIQGVVEAGFADITPAQFALFRYPGVDGLRPGEAAASIGLSKQATNGLLSELEQNGYVERHPHPDDGRARIIRLTPQGRALYRAAYAASQAAEASWAASVGKGRFQAFRSTLVMMAQRGLAAD